MFVEENRRTRRLVARLGRGESLRDALETLARDRAVTTAWVTAHGVLARATLEARIPMRPEAATSRSLEGPFELVSLTGDLASREGVMHLDAVVVLAKHADFGLVTFGGHLLDAEAEGVTVMLDCLDDLGLRRETERPTGLEGWRSANATAVRGAAPSEPTLRERSSARAETVPVTSSARPSVTNHGFELRSHEAPTPGPASVPSATAAGGGWAAVAAASAASTSSSSYASSTASKAPPGGGASAGFVDPIDDRGGRETSEEYMPVAGDWVDHRQFGLCRVDRALPDGELMIKLETGRRKEIRLDYLEVLAPRMDGARKIFPLRPRKKGV